MFFDTHAHLDYPEFAADLDGLMERANAAGITRIITIGTDLESSRKAIELAARYDMVYAAVGWHPSNVLEAPADIRTELRELARAPKVVAIGETGMDYHRLEGVDLPTYKLRQEALFEQQLEIAAESGLNAIIHQRDALEDTIAVLSRYQKQVRGVFHCFVEEPAVKDRIAAMGSIVSFTGIVTFKNAAVVKESARMAGASEYMLETDCPYLAPVPYRGKRCEPAYVREIAECLAQLRQSSLEQISQESCSTAREFFPGLA